VCTQTAQVAGNPSKHSRAIRETAKSRRFVRLLRGVSAASASRNGHARLFIVKETPTRPAPKIAHSCAEISAVAPATTKIVDAIEQYAATCRVNPHPL